MSQATLVGIRGNPMRHSHVTGPFRVNMALELKKQSLWHAFDALDAQRKGVCTKGQLKVLTFNLASSLNINDVEKKFEESTEEVTLSFLDFCKFVKTEIFSLIPIDSNSNSADTKPPATVLHMLEKVDEVCWFLCGIKYKTRPKKKLLDHECYQLWQVFNIFADGDEDESIKYPVVMDHEEVSLLLQKLFTVTGQSNKFACCDSLQDKVKDIAKYSFQQLMDLIEQGVGDILSKEELSCGVQALHNEFVMEVQQEGYLLKKGPVMTNWKDRWFILTPQKLLYFTNREQNDMKGEVLLTRQCKVEKLPERSGAHQHRFALNIPGVKCYEISAPDTKTRNEWVAALESAISKCECLEPAQRKLVLKRQRERDARRKREQEDEDKKREEEERRHADEEERIRQLEEQLAMLEQLRLEKDALLKEKQQITKLSEEQLLKEKEAREELQAKLLHEATLRQAELRRLKEMQEMKKELEKLLEEERQAKKDEEIVRSLQARILEEETAKREEMERLQGELEETLREERLKREELEDYQNLQQQQLREDQDKLTQLEIDRMAIDEQLMEALEKLKDAEKTRQAMQKKLMEKQQMAPMVSHRGLGAFSEADFKKRQVSNNNTEQAGDHPTQGNSSCTQDHVVTDNMP